MSTKHDVALMVLALLVATVCVWVPQARADGPWPIVVRSVQNGWETITLYCSEWGQWASYLAQGYEWCGAVCGEGPRTAFASEKALYPGVQYVARLARHVPAAAAAGAGQAAGQMAGAYQGMWPTLPVVPGVVVSQYNRALQPRTDCTGCYDLWRRIQALPWYSWERWRLQRQYNEQHCDLCG